VESCNINYKKHVELSDTKSRMHVKKRSGSQENKALELVHSTGIYFEYNKQLQRRERSSKLISDLWNKNTLIKSLSCVDASEQYRTV